MVWSKVGQQDTTFIHEGLLSYLLCEDDSYLLQEDDFKIALEWYWRKGPKNPGSWTMEDKTTGSWSKIQKTTGSWTKIAQPS